MKPKYLQELIKNLQEFYKCPSCDKRYRSEDINFLGEVELYYFVQLMCHGCSQPVLASVSIDGKKKAPSRKKTDLIRNERAKFEAKGAITALEIAEFYRCISRSKRLSDKDIK